MHKILQKTLPSGVLFSKHQLSMTSLRVEFTSVVTSCKHVFHKELQWSFQKWKYKTTGKTKDVFCSWGSSFWLSAVLCFPRNLQRNLGLLFPIHTSVGVVCFPASATEDTYLLCAETSWSTGLMRKDLKALLDLPEFQVVRKQDALW